MPLRLFLAALLAAPAPASSNQPSVGSSAAVPAPKPSKRALLLASLFGPPELLVDAALREAKRGFDDMVANDPQSRATEAKWPGVHAFVWREVEPQMRADSLAAERATVARIAALFQARLNPDEIEALTVYASTPQAQRMTREMIAGIRTAPPGQPAAPTPGLARRVHADFMDGLTPDELRELAAIIKTLPREKFAALGPVVKRMRLEAAVRDEPVLQARNQAAMEAAMRRYVSRSARR